MATMAATRAVRPTIKFRTTLWLVFAGTFSILLALLTVAVMNESTLAQDLKVTDWITGWSLPGLSSLLGSFSMLTDARARVIYGVLGIGVLIIAGKRRSALAFAGVGAIIALIAVLGDYTLGELVGRTRPLADQTVPSFPSGHVFGSTVFFGFSGFLAIYFGLRRRFLVPLLAIFASIIVMVGPARVYEQAHWPTDVAAGYLLAGLFLMIIIPVFIAVQKTRWASPQQVGNDNSSTINSEVRIASSIASTVILDSRAGTATKIYRPPALVRALYWLAFQARFPYDSNPMALQTAAHRRKIASSLTRFRFGKDLVAPVVKVDCTPGEMSFVTEFVPGDTVENDEEAKEFLGQVAQTFAQAGLSVWQINPRNPHAQSNLIRTPEGDLKIIDLESAVVTPLPAPGQWRSTMKRGNYPIFDDIDFPRLRTFIAENKAELEVRLGPDAMGQLEDAAGLAEKAMESWRQTEPRIWGRLTKLAYRLLDWKGMYRQFVSAMAGADEASQAFLSRGIDRWEAEGRLFPGEAASMRA